MTPEEEYLRLSDVEFALENSKRALDDRLRKVRIEMDNLKLKIVEEYLEDGVCPFNLTIRKVSPKVIITDESLIPDEFKKTTVTIDKIKLNKAVKDGDIAGTTLDNGGYTVAIKAQNAKTTQNQE